jgi:alanine racemase
MEILGTIDKEACSTWLEINLDNLRHNIRELETLTQKPVMLVVKANSYGLGLVDISKAAEQAGVAWLGVARIEEALALRVAGVKCNILVLGYTPPKRTYDAILADVALTVYDREVGEAYCSEAKAAHGKIRIHIKTDTGMGRLGFFPSEVANFLRWAKEQHQLKVEALITHFACADDPSKPSTKSQIDEFNQLLAELDSEGLKPELIHASNSSGTLNFPEARYDLTRCGISAFGIQPSQTTPIPGSFKPVVEWKTHLISAKTLPAGHGVSYGFSYYTKKEERIGVIAIGYADGFRRRDGNYALVCGKKVPVVGNVCMDQCMVNLDTVPEAIIGDEVVLIGRQNGATIKVEELAQDWGTISYEVICGLADRIPRFFIDSSTSNGKTSK